MGGTGNIPPRRRDSWGGGGHGDLGCTRMYERRSGGMLLLVIVMSSRYVFSGSCNGVASSDHVDISDNLDEIPT